MKTVDRYVLKSYLAPFAATFFVIEFVLLMQFVWKYIDDLVGKGLEWYIIFELLFYVSATMVPLAIPLTILLSSIMTMGNLAENYELTSLKAAGVSLQRVFRPLIYFSVILSVTVFYFSNYVLPVANLKMGSLLYDISHQKPAFEIQEGLYYHGIQNYVIKVDKKGKDGKTLYGIMIYDHTKRNGNTKVVLAKSGKMEFTKDKRFLLLSLFDGSSYENVTNDNPNKKEFMPFFKTYFKSQVIKMDLSDFKMTRSNEELFKDHYAMLNLKQLLAQVDSEKVDIYKRKENHYNILNGFMRLNVHASHNSLRESFVDSVYPDAIKFKTTEISKMLSEIEKPIALRIIAAAENQAINNKFYLESIQNENKMMLESLSRYMIEFHKKITLSIACLVLFFIGAPMGAIIKKGGLGMPMVVSVVFFLIFHTISIIGEKSAKEMAVAPWFGAWLATMVLMPLGVWLTFKATADSKLFDKDQYILFFKKLFRKRINTI